MKFEYHKDGTLPENGEIFVFGSNYAGRHGKGAAKVAYEKFGAVYEQGWGLQGQSYAIATKNEKLKPLTLKQIESNIGFFIVHTHVLSDKKWFVTRVGCGLAGFKDSEIAPLFIKSGNSIYRPTNCSFPEEWKPYLEEGFFDE